MRTSTLTLLLLAIGSATALAGPSKGLRITSIRVHPETIVLDGPESRRQIIVDGRLPNGETRDLTHEARIMIDGGSDPVQVVRLLNRSVVLPVRDGRTSLVVLASGQTYRVPATVRNTRKPFRWSFANHVETVLSKQGCNMGACHGAGAGKGGLRLSLRAYDPAADYARLRLEGRGRRIVKAYPEASLLLKKPSLRTSHVGGLRLRQDSLEYRVVREWIAAGAIAPRASDTKLQSLEVYPSERLLAPGAQQQLQVTALFSDGHREDVTQWARYSSNEEPIASVAESGLVTMHGKGETAVSVAYLDKVAFARVAVPFNDAYLKDQSPGLKRQGDAAPDRPDFIDTLIGAKLKRLRLQASGRCSDAEFVRRVFLDTIGTLPTSAETRAFLADTSVDKRSRLIDTLLDRPEYVDFWTYRWADVLRINRDLVGSKGMAALYGWLRTNVAENRSWDRMAYELITASGPAAKNGPANFYLMGFKPEEFAETVSQTFLGVRVQCAHCHNHPFEKWTQNDYYRMANFFARVKRKENKGEAVILTATSGDVDHPRLGRPLAPAPFDGPTLPLNSRDDRREFLADWVTSPKNPFFARTIANRIWKQLMGRGLVEPVDDMRLTNPASNEPLLLALTQEFIRGRFDAKLLIRQILMSESYQRSARANSTNGLDDRFYSKYQPRRMSAETLLDAICQVTGSREKFVGMPSGTRAIGLPDTRVASDFLDIFGRPARQVTCECERNAEPNMAQALHLITASALNGKISEKDGLIAGLVSAGKSDSQILDELYLACFSRKPTQPERTSLMHALGAIKSVTPIERESARQQVFGDLLWAMLSGPEFVYNH